MFRLSRPSLALLSPPPATAQRSTTLGSTRSFEQPCDPHPVHDDEDRFHQLNERVREMARIELEKLWDEMTALGLYTGEIIDYAVFPPSARS